MTIASRMSEVREKLKGSVTFEARSEWHGGHRKHKRTWLNEIGKLPPRLVLAGNRHRAKATRPTICYRTTIYADPTTTWGCEISSLHHRRIVEREARVGARPTSSKEPSGLTYQLCLTRNQTSQLDLRSRRNLFPRPHTVQKLTVREQLCSWWFI